MATEIELKFMGADLDRVHRRLQLHGAAFYGREFERNLVFDTHERELRRQNVLLRLRLTREARLTLKRPPLVPGEKGFKIWDELETNVQDPEAMRQLLEVLGYTLAFTYEKLRETWKLVDCVVCLDRLPFGDCVELEGEPPVIRRCAPLLALDLEQGSDKNYHQLNREYRQARKLPEDENFVFAKGTLPAIMPWDPGGLIPDESW